MADRPLRPATHRSLGEPLPHQQANGPRAHLDAEAEASFPLAGTSSISPSFLGLSQSSRQVTHVLLTRSRLCPRASPGSSLHLHVLSTPPAFVLSQDQTLREELHEKLSWTVASRDTRGRRRAAAARDPYTVVPNHDGVLLYLTLVRPRERSSDRSADAAAGGGSNLDAHHDRSIVDAHAVEFSKTAGPPEGGFPWGESDRPDALGRPWADQRV